jgi:serine/threonine protein kinase
MAKFIDSPKTFTKQCLGYPLMDANACPNRDELVAWSRGHMARERREAIAEHVEQCPACLASLKALAPAERRRRDLGPPASDSFPDEPEGRGPTARSGALGPDPDRPDRDPGCEMSPQATDEPDGSGSTLPWQLGEYQIQEELGRGGMGAVYRARHARLKRVVALKTVAAHRLNDPVARARFEREMEAVGKVDHPNIVRASDAGEFGGVLFLVMEYIEGTDLSRLVKRRGPLPVAESCEIIRQVAEGLEHAHRQGLVHRDIKPSNVMLTAEGRVKLLDLGLARLLGQPPAGEELTATGQTMGTADYMAPEQAAAMHSVDIRADLYSLGCTLYYLLAGRPPFHGPAYLTDWSKQNAHAREPVPPIRQRRPEVPEGVAAVLDRLLAKDPARRFQTPAEVASVLTSLAVGSRLPALFETEAVATPAPERAAITSTSDMRPANESASPLPSGLDQPPHPRAPEVPPRRKALFAAAALLVGFGGLFLAWQRFIVGVRDAEGKATTVIPAPAADGPPPLAVGPFPAAEAKLHQERWAFIWADPRSRPTRSA